LASVLDLDASRPARATAVVGFRAAAIRKRAHPRWSSSAPAAGRERDRENLRSGPPTAEQAVAADERLLDPLGRGHVPRRRGLRPHLLAAVVRSRATVGVHR
jgi:hypothetical protein